MGFLATIKEKAEERVISAVVAGTVLLILALWGAIPETVWGRVSDAFPKKALWALLGLFLIALCALSAYAYELRRRLKPGLEYHYGVLWDKQHTPRCPACEVPLTLFRPSKSDTTIFRCIKCKEHIRTKGVDGKTISAGDAIRTISGIE